MPPQNGVPLSNAGAVRILRVRVLFGGRFANRKNVVLKSNSVATESAPMHENQEPNSSDTVSLEG